MFDTTSLQFWNFNNQKWNAPLTAAATVTAADAVRYTAIFQSLYNGSDLFKTTIDNYLSQKNFDGVKRYINIANATDGVISSTSDARTDHNAYLSLRFSSLEEIYDFTHDGRFVKKDIGLTIAHEISHLLLGTSDPGNATVGSAPTNAQMNASNFDYKGDAVRFENMVATQLGLNSRASYSGELADDFRSESLSKSVSYTGGNYVSIVRLATIESSDINDIIDISTRQDGASMLAFGFEGNDQIKGGSGADYVYGGTGQDTINGGAGNDYLYGSDGSESKLVTESQESKQDGQDTIHGNAGNDKIYGGYGGDELYGDEGSDVVYGNQGGDKLHGGTGRDILFGGEDNDELYGDEDIDRLNGEAGDDTLEGGIGADILNGGTDNDKIYGYAKDSAGNDKDDGDRDVLVGGAGKDYLYGYGTDAYQGDSGDDIFFAKNPGTTTMDGGYGNDTYNLIHNDDFTGINITINDPDITGKIISNGYTLKGGSAYSADGSPLTEFADYYGIQYYLESNGTVLKVDLTYDTGFLYIQNWSQGKFGINLITTYPGQDTPNNIKEPNYLSIDQYIYQTDGLSMNLLKTINTDKLYFV